MSETVTATTAASSYMKPEFDNRAESLDAYGLPFEPADEFSDAPLEFEELAESLWKDLTDAYAEAVRYNRHSPSYLILCEQLEKNIKVLGSLCVTKAVLEQKNFSFPKLESLDLSELYAMVSLNFRKCHTAFQDLRKQDKGLDMKLLDWVCRWASLSERLKATDDKIRGIRDGRIKADGLLERAQTFRSSETRKSIRKPPREIRKASSLPVLGSYARELVKLKRQEEARIAREERQRKQEAQKTGPYRGFRTAPAFPALPIGRDFGEGSIRDSLTEKAVREEDREAFSAILADDDMLIEWKRKYDDILRRKSSPPPFLPARSGPSNEVRKKLREKRKKR